MNERLTIPRPDDWHVHLRDEALLAAVLGDTARHFARAIVMPNLRPPVADSAAARAYRERILAVLPEGLEFTPLMTAYLTDNSDPDDLVDGYDNAIDVSNVDISMDGIELQDREFFAAIDEGREPNASVAQCLDTMRTIDRLEQALGKPVITSNQALMFAACTILQLEPSTVPAIGQLMSAENLALAQSRKRQAA